MDYPDDDRRLSRRLTFTTENFDDYIVAVLAKLRINPIADRILSGELQHPLLQYQIDNRAHLAALQVPTYAAAQLLADPLQWMFLQFYAQYHCCHHAGSCPSPSYWRSQRPTDFC